MRDYLRRLLQRPLRDSERFGLFALAIIVIASGAAALALLDDAGPAARSARASRSTAPASPTRTPGTLIPFTPAEAPSEESEPPGALRPSVADITRSKRAARRFLSRYLAFSYGQGSVSRIPALTPELRAELARQRPRVPAAERSRRPRVELLQSNGVNHSRAELVALVADGARRYSVQLQLLNTPSGWLVAGVGS